MTDFVKGKIKWKNQFYKTHTKSGYKCDNCLQFQEATNLKSQVIAKRKDDYHDIIVSK